MVTQRGRYWRIFAQSGRELNLPSRTSALQCSLLARVGGSLIVVAPADGEWMIWRNGSSVGPVTILLRNKRRSADSLTYRAVPTQSDYLRHYSPPLAALFDIHLRLETAMAAATICSTALKAQHADSDQDAALVLQRCGCDALSVQIDRLGVVQGKLSKLV
jgi:hypothetical protein